MRYRETPWDGTGEYINKSNFENRPQKSPRGLNRSFTVVSYEQRETFNLIISVPRQWKNLINWLMVPLMHKYVFRGLKMLFTFFQNYKQICNFCHNFVWVQISIFGTKTQFTGFYASCEYLGDSGSTSKWSICSFVKQNYLSFQKLFTELNLVVKI